MPRSKTRKAPKRGSAGTGRRGGADRHDQALRLHLVNLLSKEQAHTGFRRAVADLPVRLRGTKIAGSPHTPWQLIEHLRIAQWDILEFSRNPRHVSPPFPQGYWPPTAAPPEPPAWDRSVRDFLADLEAMVALVRNPRTDLFARIPHGEGQTVLREAMLVADHNAYHIGQLILLRRLAGCWEGR